MKTRASYTSLMCARARDSVDLVSNSFLPATPTAFGFSVWVIIQVGPIGWAQATAPFEFPPDLEETLRC